MKPTPILERWPHQNPFEWMVRNIGATDLAAQLDVPVESIRGWVLDGVPLPDEIRQKCYEMVGPLLVRLEARAQGEEEPADEPLDIINFIWSSDGPPTRSYR